MTQELCKLNTFENSRIHFIFTVIIVFLSHCLSYHFSSHSCNSAILKWEILFQRFFEDLAGFLQQRGKLFSNQLTADAIKQRAGLFVG